MATDPAGMKRELTAARLRLHRDAVRVSTLATAAMVVALAVLLRDIGPAALGLSALGAALFLRAAVGWAHTHRAAWATSAAWLRAYRLSYAVHGGVWLLIGWQMTAQAGPERHALLVFILTALTAGALVTAAFDWVAALLFGGLAFAPLVLRLLTFSDRTAQAETAVAVIFVLVMLLTLRRSELALRHGVRQQIDLAAQNYRMTQLLATTRQGCWFIDAQGTTADVNDAMCEMLGRPREALVGRAAWDLFSGEALATLQREVAARKSGSDGAYAITITRPDGTQRHCRNNASPLLDAEGVFQGSVGLWTDLTDIVEATHDLQVHAWAINSITDAVSVVSEDAIYRMVNDTWCRNTGMPREQVIGRSARTLLPSLSTTRRVAAVQACLASNEVQVLRGAVELPGLQDRIVQTHLYPYGGTDAERCVVMVSRDVTAEEQVLRALQASEAEQRALLDAFPGGIARLDRELVYRYVNQQLADLLGTTPEAMVGHTVRDLFGEASEARVRDECNRALAGEVVASDRRLYQAPGRPETWVQVTTAAGKDMRTGEPQFYAFCADVTSLHRARLAMDEARAEAERANRAKSQFLSQMSHELRTPLNAILGFAELLETDARQPLAEGQSRHLREIRRGGQHLLGLINEMLELGRIEAGHLAVAVVPVDLQELLGACLDLVQPLARARPVHLLPLRADAAASHVLADPMRLKQVLLNLLGNAIKYNHTGGTVEVSWAVQGARVQISVRDNGPGLAPADQARAFEPFERLGAARSAVEGAGIGLALSRRLAQAMDGEIGVDSQPGQGSTFWLRLPRLAAPVDDLAASVASDPTPTPTPSTPPPAGARVLYIEDNPVNLVLMEAMLARMPELTARCVMSPADGLALAVAEPPDLVLLDLQMPLMDGFEVLRRLRALPALRHIPVYAVSANALQLDIDAAQRAGFDGYLTKPIQLDTLMSTVRQALRTHRAVAAP